MFVRVSVYIHVIFLRSTLDPYPFPSSMKSRLNAVHPQLPSQERDGADLALWTECGAQFVTEVENGGVEKVSVYGDSRACGTLFVGRWVL